jgi:hypothetical protein
MSSGYRFAGALGNGNGGFVGSEGQAFVDRNGGRRGRGRGNADARMADGDQSFYAGEGGVETYPGCYGLPTYCGWQQVAGTVTIPAATDGVLSVLPTVSPYFEPKAVYLFGIDPNAPGTNLRFTIGAVTVGGSPQMAINKTIPTGTGVGGGELLSDVFNRSDEPLLINWSVFSTTGLARELQINLFNLNGNTAVQVFACIWGNAVSSLDGYV